MSQLLINHSPDLKRLSDEGFEVEIKANHLLINSVPYVNQEKHIKYGILVSELTLAGDKTATPSTHVVHFIGQPPCHKDGTVIREIINASNDQVLGEGLVINHSFSSKPDSGYPNYYDKMTRYIEMVSHPAEAIDNLITAKTFKVIKDQDEESVFNYRDTASSRAGINTISDKLKIHKIGIIGLGGTGSYILDLMAKTPVKEIHLFDGDKFFQHNAFRSPGAPSIEELSKGEKKVNYFANTYSKMRKNIFPHDDYINSLNVDQLDEMDFVFICIDKGAVKKLIIDRLQDGRISFIDVGMGIEKIVNQSLLGIIRVTTSTEGKRDHTTKRVSLLDGENDEYSTNIQIADLNALNATLAVIKWKKLCGFYQDLENEHNSTYSLNVNQLVDEECYAT